MAFTRTPGGLVEKWNFHKEPTIWVEGPTDVYFYRPLLNTNSIRIEAFHGTGNARALIDALLQHDYPYIVVIDGDYNILRRTRSKHRRVIRLERYSFENYLWEPDHVNEACLISSQCGVLKDVVKARMLKAEKDLEATLLDHVVMDIASQNSRAGVEVLPKAIEQYVCKTNSMPAIDAQKTKAKLASISSLITEEARSEADNIVQTFLQKRPFVHLLRGHLLFGLLRLIFAHVVEKERRGKMQMPQDLFLQLIGEKVATHCKSRDHKRLRQKLRRCLNEVMKAYPTPQGMA